MNLDLSAAGFKRVGRDELREEREHDSYKSPFKLPEPSACPDCGAIFHSGRWQWGQRQPDSAEIVCPTCRRIHDQFPAGFLHLGGAYFAAHRGEILNLIRYHSEKEWAQHAQSRVISLKENDVVGATATGDAGILITTTDTHLARYLGETLNNAYQGQLEFRYNEAENLLRVHWRR